MAVTADASARIGKRLAVTDRFPMRAEASAATAIVITVNHSVFIGKRSVTANRFSMRSQFDRS